MFFVQCFLTETSALTGLFSGMTYQPFLIFAHRALAAARSFALVASDIFRVFLRPRFNVFTAFWSVLSIRTSIALSKAARRRARNLLSSLNTFITFAM